MSITWLRESMDLRVAARGRRVGRTSGSGRQSERPWQGAGLGGSRPRRIWPGFPACRPEERHPAAGTGALSGSAGPIAPEADVTPHRRPADVVVGVAIQSSHRQPAHLSRISWHSVVDQAGQLSHVRWNQSVQHHPVQHTSVLDVTRDPCGMKVPPDEARIRGSPARLQCYREAVRCFELELELCSLGITRSLMLAWTMTTPVSRTPRSRNPRAISDLVTGRVHSGTIRPGLFHVTSAKTRRTSGAVRSAPPGRGLRSRKSSARAVSLAPFVASGSG